jgi:hypothetical protein
MMIRNQISRSKVVGQKGIQSNSSTHINSLETIKIGKDVVVFRPWMRTSRQQDIVLSKTRLAKQIMKSPLLKSIKIATKFKALWMVVNQRLETRKQEEKWVGVKITIPLMEKKMQVGTLALTTYLHVDESNNIERKRFE